jgi:DNA gyrase subunit A
MLRDIDSDTVDFGPNYDESRREPQVLPSRFPNLLVNGSTGIAVGMATNIPPHNLAETIDAVVALIDKPTASVDDLMKHVKGPDFPTGGIIVGRSGIRDAYRTGRGRVVMRARAHVEEMRGGRNAIIVTELPYGVKKGGDGGVISKIADLVREKVITEVSDLQDYSDKTGMRIQIELKREAVPQVALNKLFKHSPLQTTFGYNAVALVDGVPRTLSLLEFVRHYLDFQREVVTRRSQYELRKALDRAHVLEGYLIALDHLDEVIALIRASDDAEEARSGLMEQFGLSEVQAQAILDLRLRALTGLERKRVEDEYKDLQERISELRTLLGDESRIAALIKEELLEIKQIYGKGDDRRSEIIAAEDEFELEDLIAEEDMVIAITRSGYVKRLPVTTYREQRRGGIGVMGMDLKDDDYIEHLFVASTHDYILFFSSTGKVYRLKVHELPLGSRQSKGRAIVNLLPFRQEEKVRAVIRTRDFSEMEYLVLATRNGIVKKTKFTDYNTPLKSEGIIAINLREDDELVEAFLSSGSDDLMLVSRRGQAIRFLETEARPMGRATGGVRGMSLREGDEVIAAMVARDDDDLLVVTEQGYGKRTPIRDYPRKGRGGLGVKTVQLAEAKGQLAGARHVREGHQVMLISTGGTVIKMPVEGIRRAGRATQGVIVMRLRGDERVSALARVVSGEGADVDVVGEEILDDRAAETEPSEG